MKVAFIRDLFGMGGIESVLHNTAVALKEYDFEFYAVCTGADAYKGNFLWDTYKEVKVIILPDNRGGIFNEVNQKAFLKFINENKIDLICCDYYMEGLIELVHNNTKSKVLFWYHNSPIAKKLSIISKGDKIIKNKPILKFTPFKFLIKLLAYKKWKKNLSEHKYLITNSDFVTVLNDIDRVEFIKYLKLDKNLAEKIKVLINPIYLIENPNTKKENLIVYMGRFDYEQKRVERFVDIWKLIYKDLPDWRLELYGDGDSFDMVKEKIQKAKLERIHLMGRTDNPNEVYDNAAIVALTSQFEGWGMVLAEGQNNGCVSIAFASAGGIKTVIKGGGGIWTLAS